ncbi:hypothetical protein Q31b_01130 [Novipirellula aureliae]|uniref:Uncharacterized protein n=1 Tax=Novipirellula aureliae TaxID=2527966 RepID=A0A5C6E7L5_9BACT|nr:hypothetical protein [Novipirellula aureliae]TWU44942.1 hypothetical protein Q31b_01130 [Novipirellula aureliae]
MPHLDPSTWQLQPAFQRNLSRLHLGDYSMLEIFTRGMSFLHDALQSGLVYRHARELWSQFPPVSPTHSSFSYLSQELEELLKNGDFMYSRESRYFHQEGSVCPVLDIQEIEIDVREWAIGIGYPGYAIIGIRSDWLTVLKADYPLVFSNDRIGRDRFAWEVAALVLHEVVHNHGFLHPDFNDVLKNLFVNEALEMEFNPENEYYRTLPCIAGQSVYLASAKYFEGTNYNPASVRRWPIACGCLASRQNQPKIPTEGAQVRAEVTAHEGDRTAEPVYVRVNKKHK